DDATLVRVVHEASADAAFGGIAVVVPVQRIAPRPVKLAHAAELDSGKPPDRAASQRTWLHRSRNHAEAAQAGLHRLLAALDDDVAFEQQHLGDRTGHHMPQSRMLTV